MTEITIQWIAILKLLCVVIFAGLYGFGGVMWRQQLRRFGASSFLTLAIVGFSIWTQTFSWWYLSVLPILYGSLSLGYGADETWLKITKRGYCGLAYACASLPIAIVTGNWVLFALHTILCLGVSITLGVLNPLPARYEETLIGTTISLLPLFM